MAKSTVIRTAGIVAASGTMLAATVVPANAFAVAEVSAPVQSAPVQSEPVLASHADTYNNTWSYNNWGYQATDVAQVEDTAVTPQAAPAATSSSAREAVLAAAYDGIGGAYVWGGKSYKSWDCSGFVSYVYAQAGINLTAYTYAMAGELTPTSNPQPGDIVFTNGYAHVGIYVGNGQMISALNPSQGTMLSSVDGGGFMPVDGYYTAGI
ncbi:hypothetical protein A7979_03905 [Rothia nasimurium]|uniref:NlpC/P60 domain-containing protein n=1 Tax=Rothia nasimurium TaxID=85336 RepID=A0A1Y1RNN7_9MICC|nr:C40 family peptidase [Rothia nasimurium]ORC16473.1 hypothetical protein A7979_03905 [Rothia nasimurium]